MNAIRTRAPGRVNIIGEHTDYNDGFVLPCAIAAETRVHARVRPDSYVHARSSNAESETEFDLERLPGRGQGAWSDYILGILAQLRASGVQLRGADLEITGDVPIGAGLSSSASLEISVALAILAAAEASMDRKQLALLAQRAEIGFAGTRCGIMDQFTVLFAETGSALFLDTRSLEFQRIDLPAGGAIIICNTMVKHSLAAGAYNERRAQCEEGVRLLQQRYSGIAALRDVSLAQLEAAKEVLTPAVFARCRHVVTENARVEAAVEAMRGSRLAALGVLMYESHESLRVDYEVSCAELDLMVDTARRFPGTIGARMTGGGFGGCTVNVVHAQQAQEFGVYMRETYRERTGITPEIYDGTPSAGACIVHE